MYRRKRVEVLAGHHPARLEGADEKQVREQQNVDGPGWGVSRRAADGLLCRLNVLSKAATTDKSRFAVGMESFVL